MALGTGLSRVTGLARVAAMTYAIGVSESRFADAYNIANTLPNVIYELVLGGVLTSVFLPVLVEDLKTATDDEEASRRVSALFSGTAAALALFTAVAVVLAPIVIGAFSFRLPPGEREIQQVQATFFFRFFALQIFFYGYTAMTAGLLNSYHRFAATAFSPVANNVVVIATFLGAAALLRTHTGAVAQPPPAVLLLLAIGTTAGVAAMALCQWPSIRRLPLEIRPVRGLTHLRRSSFSKLARLSGWIVAHVATNQAGFAVALVLANGIQGGPTAYFIAFSFFQLPYGLVAVSIITAVIPTLAGLWVDGDTETMALRLVRAIRATTTLLLPLTIGMVLLAEPAISLLLEHGVMSAASSKLVSQTLIAFMLGTVPFALWVLVVKTFYALQDSRTPFLLNLLEVGVTVVLDFVLFPRFQIVGLAAAHSAGYWIGATIAIFVLFRRLGRFPELKKLGPMWSTATAAVVSGATTWAVLAFLDGRAMGPEFVEGDLRKAALVLVGGLVTVASYYGAGKLLRSGDVTYLERLFRPWELTADVAEAPVKRRRGSMPVSDKPL